MKDFAHYVLDNKAGMGDAVLEADGVAQRFGPISGATSIALLHALVAATIESLLARCRAAGLLRRERRWGRRVECTTAACEPGPHLLPLNIFYL